MNKANILVIEDTEDIGLMLKMTLEYKNYKVILLKKTDLLFSVLETEKIDMILMDMLLSGVNGIDICRELKANEKTAKIPLVMMSAHPDAKNLCMEAGASDFIAKPFNITEMLDKISLDFP